MDYIVVSLIFPASVLLIGAYVYRKKTREKRMNAYFCAAVRVYALTDDEDVRVAILTAAKAAGKKPRNSMVRYLQIMASDIKNMTEIDPKVKPHTDKFAESSIELAEEISSREWAQSDIDKQKEELGNINSEYFEALEKADPAIFSDKYPHLFKK